MFCYRCGAENSEDSVRCRSCGAELAVPPLGGPATVPHEALGPGTVRLAAAPSPPPAPSERGAGPTAVEVLIPYRNGAALTAYYLGVFSIVCGLLLGIPALVLGIMGLRRAQLHPEARGKAHAWVGIVLGSLTTLASLVLIGLAISSFLATRR
jgi:hypothetical protein